jgi:uncharacterized protein YjbJ (UPF0337 family)
VRVADYREVDDGPYDKVASVGMYEHVGAAQLDDYMRRVHRLLRPGGLFLNHGIVRQQTRPWDYHSFIARYVFPDGELHTIATVVAALEHAELEVRDDESLREHYTLTLRRWLANLASNREDAIAEAGADRERVWRLYMTGSALSFERGDISVHQVLAAAPGARHGLPLARSASPREIKRPLARSSDSLVSAPADFGNEQEGTLRGGNMGIFDKWRGRAKQAAGDLTDSAATRREGKKEEQAADIKEEAAREAERAEQKRQEAANLDRGQR